MLSSPTYCVFNPTGMLLNPFHHISRSPALAEISQRWSTSSPPLFYLKCVAWESGFTLRLNWIWCTWLDSSLDHRDLGLWIPLHMTYFRLYCWYLKTKKQNKKNLYVTNAVMAPFILHYIMFFLQFIWCLQKKIWVRIRKHKDSQSLIIFWLNSNNADVFTLVTS